MAGKTSTAKALVEKIQTEGVAVKLLKETTTRPKRESDYNNPEYNFVTIEEYKQKDFLVSVDFKVSNGDIWSYGIENQNFPDLGIIVSNMYAVDSLLTNPLPDDLDVIIFYLSVSEKEALKRDRGDRLSQKGDDVIERIKRDINKYNAFYEKHENYIYEIYCNNTPLKEVVDCIYYHLIRKQKNF